MVAVVVADDLWVLLVGWELMGACSYFLISHHWELGEARGGAVKAFLMTRTADLGLLFAILVLGERFDSYRISAVMAAVTDQALPRDELWLPAVLIAIAVMGKSAQFPFHTWLPDAMPGPTPISALIHAATMVAAGVFLVARVYPLFLSAPVGADAARAHRLRSRCSSPRSTPWSPTTSSGCWPGRRSASSPTCSARSPWEPGRRRCCTCWRTARSRRCCSSPPGRSSTPSAGRRR